MYVVPFEDLYDKLYNFHVHKTGHGGRNKMEAALILKYSIPRPAIELCIYFMLQVMEREKKRGKKKKMFGQYFPKILTNVVKWI